MRSSTGQGLSSEAALSLGAAIMEKRNQGILVVNHLLQLQFINESAKQLLLYLLRSSEHKGRLGTLPTIILNCYEELRALLLRHPDPRSWERHHVTRTFDSAKGSIIIRGFGIPGNIASENSHLLLLTIEQVVMLAPREYSHHPSSQHITKRQEAVVRCLREGMTNKEIATRLGLSVFTIKDHVKHLRERLGTTTRTGIVARTLGVAGEKDLASR